MSQGKLPAHRGSVSRFWDNYLFILKKNAISKSSIPWYRKHTEAYIKANKGTPLIDQTAQDIDRYLNAKGRLPELKEWQFRQIADAIRLLFTELIQPQWSKSYDWFQWRAFSRELESDHPSLMRDANPKSLVAPSSNQHILRFRTNYAETHLAFVKTIRVRQMAVKTEKTYEQWIARFLRFCNWQEIDRLGLDNVKSFLEYLAVSRKVSGSTQKVALNALIFLFREVLGRDVENILSFTRASSKQRIPTVLSVDEIKCLLGEMNGRSKLMASLMYGTGMRVMECA